VHVCALPALIAPVVIHAARINKTKPTTKRKPAKMMGLWTRDPHFCKWLTLGKTCELSWLMQGQVFDACNIRIWHGVYADHHHSAFAWACRHVQCSAILGLAGRDWTSSMKFTTKTMRRLYADHEIIHA
jgi:hypothetical protein